MMILGNMEEDSWLWHMYDTVKGSDWLGDQVYNMYKYFFSRNLSINILYFYIIKKKNKIQYLKNCLIDILVHILKDCHRIKHVIVIQSIKF